MFPPFDPLEHELTRAHPRSRIKRRNETYVRAEASYLGQESKAEDLPNRESRSQVSTLALRETGTLHRHVVTQDVRATPLLRPIHPCPPSRHPHPQGPIHTCARHHRPRQPLSTCAHRTERPRNPRWQRQDEGETSTAERRAWLVRRRQGAYHEYSDWAYERMAKKSTNQ